MDHYFYLQFKIINRKLKEFGVHPILGYLLGIGIFIGLSFYLFYKTEYASYIYSSIGVAFLSGVNEENRIDFLKSQFSTPHFKTLRLLENCLIIIPFILFLLFKMEFVIGMVLLIVSILLSQFNLKSKWHFTFPTPFSKNPFEFPVGFRKTWWVFLIAYFLCIMAVLYNNYNLGVFSMLIVFLVNMSYYGNPEDLFYTWIFKDKPSAFLINKAFIAIKYSSLIIFPILLVLLYYFPENRMITPFLPLIGFLYLLAIIFAKYAAYPKEINVPQGLVLGISLWLPPLLLLIIPFFYKQAVAKLKPILS